MMVEAFDTWRTAEGARSTTAASSTPTATPTSRTWSTRPELARGDPVVDRQRDPGLDLDRRRPDRRAADRRHQGGRHDAADRDRLGQVPQRARARAPRAGPDPRATLDGLGLNYNTAKSVDALHAAYPDEVPLRVRVLVGDLDPRRLPGPAAAEHRRELHAGQARRLLLRQQPRVLDDERRVRPQEGPRPQVLPRRVPVVGLRLHRRADAVRRVPGEVVVLRRGRHRRLPEGHVLPVPEPVDAASRWSTCCR